MFKGQKIVQKKFFFADCGFRHRTTVTIIVIKLKILNAYNKSV